MELLSQVLDIFLHLDAHLNDWALVFGPWLYLVLFAIVFCETGLVATPFLPGDSLLFAVGALAAIEGSPLQVPLLILVLVAAAVLGDGVNYAVGFHLGPRVFRREDSLFFNKKHLVRTHRFYQRHGGKTIILARFMPIIRTFAPFVAGIGRMSYRRFSLYNVTGGIAWVISFVLAGYLFGGLPSVKRNFHFVLLAIILLSVLPGVIEILRARRAGGASAGGGQGEPAAAPVAEQP